MKIEELTHEDYMEIAKIIPLKMKISDMEKYSSEIAEKYSMPAIDATASLFISFAIKTGQSVLGYENEKERRINEVVRLRG